MTRLNERLGFSGGSVVKNPPANAGDLGSIPGTGRFSGGGNGIPTLVFLSWKLHGQRSLPQRVHGVAKVRHDLVTIQQQQRQMKDWVQKGERRHLGELPVLRPFYQDALSLDRAATGGTRSGRVGSPLLDQV